MELIRTIRDKCQTQKEDNLQKQAEQVITLSDFGDSLYIAYEGTPMLYIEPYWTSKKIIQKLTVLRQNYINTKLLNLC